LLSMSILLTINWQLSMLVFVVLIFFVVMFFIFTPIIERLERQRFTAKADFFSRFIEKIDGIQVVKAMGLEHYSSGKLRGSIDELIRIQTKSRYVGMANSITSSLVVSFSVLLLIVFTSREMILYNTLSLGMILTFITLSSKIFSAFGSLLDKNLSLQEHKVILNRFFDFEEKKSVQQETPQTNRIRDFQFQQFALRDVSFSYNDETDVLKKINLEVNKGDKIWIQGKNGTGKSTLCKIMGFLYAPGRGELSLNGLAVDMYNRRELRKKIVLISSDDLIFNESLLFNISFGRKLDMVRLMEFAKVLNFYSFIEKQADGFHTVMHENGRNLSTGQRRKVLMLRALMSESQVIILDEIFNGIDVETQRRAQIVLDMIDDKTFVIISHIPLPQINFNKHYGIEDGQLFPKTA
ncbi:MAG: ATP-binding cassette domain-containing protein, partial [Bacteroidota bacterium]